MQSKFYYFDAGVYQSLRPKSLYDKVKEIDGPALEGLVAQHLKAWINAQVSLHQLHFWRTSTKLEVDFIVYGPTCFLAIEVKNRSVLHPVDFHGLQACMEDYPEVTPLLLYRGKHRYKERGIVCMPIEKFLMNIHPDTALVKIS